MTKTKVITVAQFKLYTLTQNTLIEAGTVSVSSLEALQKMIDKDFAGFIPLPVTQLFDYASLVMDETADCMNVTDLTFEEAKEQAIAATYEENKDLITIHLDYAIAYKNIEWIETLSNYKAIHAKVQSASK